MRTEDCTPHASLLIESMRDIGYTLETALADVIDNSLTAGSRHVRLRARTTGSEPCIAIIDDGAGMTEATLLSAMRLGSKSPLEERDKSDLGRFGLGLKTASFSQCRRLTVVTKHEGSTSCACWDLDYVVETDEWRIQILADWGSVPFVEELETKGTLVLWEKLDRLTDSQDSSQQHLNRRLNEAATHLELVFHRFLSAPGTKKVKISLNNRDLVPFDPFHISHPATDPGPVEKIRIRGNEIIIQPFTLPHHQKVTPAEWDRYAGPEGYVKNQGFYVYRGGRLIIHGTWFGLARQMELTKLARVRIDMPNGLDAEWKIDVKKASAHPPPVVRERLRKLLDSIGASSKRVYTSRGRRLMSDRQLPVWNKVQDHNLVSYKVNADHPVFADFMSRLADDTRQDFSKIIEMVGSSVPIEDIFVEYSGHPENVSAGGISPEALLHVVEATVRQLREAGITNPQILEMIRHAEPFRSRWQAVEPILNGLSQE